MCRLGTARVRLQRGAVFFALTLLTLACADAQNRLDWRHIGTYSLDLGLASAASGPVSRLWYSPDGSRLMVATASGKTFQTQDFERWVETRESGPEISLPLAVASSTPEGGVRLVAAQNRPGRLYALGTQAYRSDDGGASWTGLTRYRNESILGDGLSQIAVSPRDPDEIVVAGASGVWRSLDAGDTWVGLNDQLPNLPVRRLVSVPSAGGPVRIQARGDWTREFEWTPGDRFGWRAVPSSRLTTEKQTLDQLSRMLAAPVTVFETRGEYVYAGTSDGNLLASRDLGRTWQSYALPGLAAVNAIFVDPQEPWIALVALQPGNDAPVASPRLLRTMSGGGVWLDITGNLPAGSVLGVTADRTTGAVYAALDGGLFFSYADLRGGGPVGSWTQLAGLPPGRALDVKLDTAGNQIYTAMEGYGIYAALAPHRMRDLRVVSAADLQPRAAAPGALMSVLGGPVSSARTATGPVPVLAASAEASQIQIPFDVTGSSLDLAIQAQGRKVNLGLALKTVSPAIFAAPDGQPMIVNADTGSLLDPLSPVHSGGRLQVFATGLGKVRPDWPAGMAAPLENPPQVQAAVKAYLNREPVEVTRAILAPGYIGFYLVEIQLPKVVDAGQAELLLEAEGQSSNRVIIYLEP